MTERGQTSIVDIVLAFLVLVAILVTAPFWYEFIGIISADADPFSQLLLQLAFPILLLALVVSVGVSARRRLGGA